MAKLQLVCCDQPCDLPGLVDVRGLLSFWLLWELRLGELLGAQLAERLAWRRGEPVSNGTLYPALAKLEAARLVRKRKRGRDTAYELTDKGQGELDCAARYLRTILRDVLDG